MCSILFVNIYIYIERKREGVVTVKIHFIPRVKNITQRARNKNKTLRYEIDKKKLTNNSFINEVRNSICTQKELMLMGLH